MMIEKVADLKVKAFMAGFGELYEACQQHRPPALGIARLPLNQLETIRSQLKSLKVKYRIRYAGPRHDRCRMTVLKADAKSFYIYLNE